MFWLVFKKYTEFKYWIILLLISNYKLQEFCPIPILWVGGVGHICGRDGTHLKITEKSTNIITRKITIIRKSRLCSTGPTNQLRWQLLHVNIIFFLSNYSHLVEEIIGFSFKFLIWWIVWSSTFKNISAFIQPLGLTNLLLLAGVPFIKISLKLTHWKINIGSTTLKMLNAVTSSPRTADVACLTYYLLQQQLLGRYAL